MAKYPEHDIIRQTRKRHDIAEDADIGGAFAEIFVKRSPEGRKADLARLDEELSKGANGANEARELMQVHRWRSHLADLDERLKRGGL